MTNKFWLTLGAFLLPLYAFAVPSSQVKSLFEERSGRRQLTEDLMEIYDLSKWSHLKVVGGTLMDLYVKRDLTEIVVPAELKRNFNGREFTCAYWIHSHIQKLDDQLRYSASSMKIYFDKENNGMRRAMDALQSKQTIYSTKFEECSEDVKAEDLIEGIARGNVAGFNPRRVRYFDTDMVMFGGNKDSVTPWQTNIFVADETRIDITQDFISWYSGEMISGKAYTFSASFSIDPKSRNLKMLIENSRKTLSESDKYLGLTTCVLDIKSKIERVTVNGYKTGKSNAGIYVWVSQHSLKPEAFTCIKDRFEINNVAIDGDLIGFSVDFARANAIRISLKDTYVLMAQ